LPEILLLDCIFTEKLRENKCLKHNKNFYKFWVLTFMKMPKISKQCEECGGSSPVACKSCTVCGADFYTSEKADSPGEDTESTPQRR